MKFYMPFHYSHVDRREALLLQKKYCFKELGYASVLIIKQAIFEYSDGENDTFQDVHFPMPTANYVSLYVLNDFERYD